MTKTDQTHHFSETTCRHIGGPCPAMTRMLRALAGALDKARPVTQEDFEICGESILDGCSRECPARFFATHDRIRVFCDVSAEADRRKLDQFADALLSPRSTGFPAGQTATYPCALGEALPKPAHSAATALQQALPY